MAKVSWAKQLGAYVRATRKSDPLPARSALTPAQEMQCRILGGHLIHWLREDGPELMAERAALSTTRGATDQPLVVFVSDTPGLVAAAQILGTKVKNIVCCRSSELDAFPHVAEDETFALHCELHSYFDGPRDIALMEKALRDHPPSPGEEVWLHHACSVMGPLFARGAHHLWHWNGEEPRLVEEAWNRWIS